MKSAGDPPPAPDPTTSANAQSAANIQTAIANARLNRVNQTTPWGSINYTQTGVDANGVPIYASNIALSPQQQALLERQQTGQLSRSQMANQVLNNGSSAITRPLDLSSLHSVYDRYAQGQQWNGNPQAPAAPAAQPPAPTAQSAPSSQPYTPSAQPDAASSQPGAIPMSGGNMAALIGALRSGAAPAAGATGAAPQDATAPEGGDPFGAWGNLNGYIGTNKPDMSKLPPEIAAQLQDEVRVDEGGGQTHNYSFNQNPWGGFTDKDGKQWVQVGDPAKNNAGDGGIKDRSKVVYQSGAGYVTTPDNLNDYGKGGIDWRMVAIALGAGALGTAAGLGGAAAGEGAGAGLAGTMTGAAGDESLGLAMGSGGSGGLGTGAGSALTGTMDTAGSSGFGGTVPIGGEGLAPVTDLSTGAATQQPTVLQQMMNNMQQGRGLLGMSTGQRAAVGGGVSLLSQMLNRGQQQGTKR